MQIVIDLSNEMYQAVKDGTWCGNELWYNALKNGTPLPKNHGRLIDADATLHNHCEFDCKRKPYCFEDCAIYDMFKYAPTIIPADGGMVNESDD